MEQKVTTLRSGIGNEVTNPSVCRL